MYSPQEKAEIERVINVFRDYIKDSTYLDLVWSDKIGYIYLIIDGLDRPHAEGRYVKSAEHLASVLLGDIETDVFLSTGNEHSLEDADYRELAEIDRRQKPFLDQLPEYRYLSKKTFCWDEE